MRHGGEACGCDARDVEAGLMPVDQALTTALRLVVPIATQEQVPLAQATGRVLAEAMRTQTKMPPFDASAVDGYAVCLGDLTGPGPWNLGVQDRVPAGDGRLVQLAPVAVARIFTGAPLPVGADAVVMQEDVTSHDGRLQIRHRPNLGANLRLAGEEMALGQIVVPIGSRIGVRHIGALAANGHGEVTVWRRPRVALLTTGNEVLPTGALLWHRAAFGTPTPAFWSQPFRQPGPIWLRSNMPLMTWPR